MARTLASERAKQAAAAAQQLQDENQMPSSTKEEKIKTPTTDIKKRVRFTEVLQIHGRALNIPESAATDDKWIVPTPLTRKRKRENEANDEGAENQPVQPTSNKRVRTSYNSPGPHAEVSAANYQKAKKTADRALRSSPRLAGLRKFKSATRAARQPSAVQMDITRTDLEIHSGLSPNSSPLIPLHLTEAYTPPTVFPTVTPTITYLSRSRKRRHDEEEDCDDIGDKVVVQSSKRVRGNKARVTEFSSGIIAGEIRHTLEPVKSSGPKGLRRSARVKKARKRFGEGMQVDDSDVGI